MKQLTACLILAMNEYLISRCYRFDRRTSFRYAINLFRLRYKHNSANPQRLG